MWKGKGIVLVPSCPRWTNFWYSLPRRSRCGKEQMCSVTCRLQTPPVPSTSCVQRFRTSPRLKAPHPARSCPASSARGCFYHTVAVSCWAHSTGSFPETWQAHSDPTIALQLSVKKASHTLSRAPSSSEQSKWHKTAQEICPSCQASPEPATAAGTSWVPGMNWQGEDNWGQRDQKQLLYHNPHLASGGYQWLKQAASWDYRMRELSQAQWSYSGWPQQRTEPSSRAIETSSISQISKANQKIKVMIT